MRDQHIEGDATRPSYLEPMGDALRCRMPAPFRYGRLGFMLVLTLVGAPLLIIWSNKGGPGAPPASFAFLWIAGMAWVRFCSAALFPYEIRLSEDGELEFKSVLRSVKVNARDLLSIAPGFRGWIPTSCCSRRERGLFAPCDSWKVCMIS